MNISEIYKKMQGAKTHVGNNYISQISNSRQALSALNGMDGVTDDQQDKLKSGEQASIAQSLTGMAGTIAGGLGGIISNTINMAGIADTTQMDNTIASMADVGSSGYGSFDDISQDATRMSQLDNSLDLSYDAIRGKSDAELAGGVLSNAASGALAGLQVGGPWGALAGGVIGLGSGIAGALTGNAAARTKQATAALDRKEATLRGRENIASSSDALRDRSFRNAYANRAARGGQLERKTINIREFAYTVLDRQRKADRTHSSGLVRRHCNGGTMIRIKR